MLKFISNIMGSSQSLSQQSAVDMINKWRSRPRHELIFDCGRHEISLYLQAIDKLHESNAKGSNDKLISTAVERLKVEFEAVLRRHSDLQTGPVSTTDISSFSDSTANAPRYEEYVLADTMTDDVISFLRNIGERMRSRGRIEECVKLYKNVRKPFLQSKLKQLRFDELRGDHNPRRYVHDELKVKMELWIEVSKICVKILFQNEKNLCDWIFGSNDVTGANECFVGTVKDSAVPLFRFAEEMSSRRQAFDKMGPVLGVYDAFLWVLPSAEALFLSPQGKGIRDVCAQAASRIEGDVVRMLYDLQHDILHEKIESDVSEGRGAVHRTTEVAMDQIDMIVKKRDLLAKLIKSPPLLNFGDVVFPQEELIHYTNNSTSSNFLEQHLVLTILVLVKNLEMKCRSYKDPSLGHLFMMNNVRCILKGIEGSEELQEMFGARLVGRLSEKLESARTSYETTTCDMFLTCLRKKGLYINRCCLGPKPSKAAIKRRLNEFNNVFESKIDNSSWKIPDHQLREEVRRDISRVLVKRYTEFLDEFGNNPETRLIVEGNKKHSAEDLEALVQNNLFADSEF